MYKVNLENYPKTLTSHQFSYIAHTGYLSNKNNEKYINHMCGKLKSKNIICIEPTHMCIENISTNLNRKICHNKICKFEEKYTTNDNIKTFGTIFIDDIDQEYVCPNQLIKLVYVVEQEVVKSTKKFLECKHGM